MSNAVIEAIKDRRSIRRFKPEQITDQELQTVLEAGTYAATGHGKQNPWIVAVQQPDIVAKLSAMNSAIWGRDIDPFYGAPTIVLVFASHPNECTTAVQDGSLVLGNMMLAAHAIGLGSCWINREREMFSTPEGIALMHEFGLPEGLIGIGALSLGYPDGEPRPAAPRKENYFRVIK